MENKEIEPTALIPLVEITEEDIAIAFDSGLLPYRISEALSTLHGFMKLISHYGNFESYEYLKSKNYDVTFSATWPEHYKSIMPDHVEPPEYGTYLEQTEGKAQASIPKMEDGMRLNILMPHHVKSIEAQRVQDRYSGSALALTILNYKGGSIGILITQEFIDYTNQETKDSYFKDVFNQLNG